jgi:hypothetical protein
MKMGSQFFVRISLGLCALPLLLTLGSCASTEKRARYEIVLHEEAYVTIMNGKPVLKPAGVPLEFDQDELPLYIQKPGYLGIFVVPTNSQSEKIDVALQPFDVWASEWGQHYADRSLQDVLLETARVQQLFAANNPQAALDRIETLQAKYPKIHTLKFLKASCLILLGEKERAKVVLEDALRAWPNNRAGLDLFRSLTGRAYTPESSRGQDEDPLPVTPTAEPTAATPTNEAERPAITAPSTEPVPTTTAPSTEAEPPPLPSSQPIPTKGSKP